MTTLRLANAIANPSVCRLWRTQRTQRKRLRWQPLLAASIEHSYWLALAFVAWKIESVLSLSFLTQWPLASVAWLALAYFFWSRNFLAFIAFLAHFLFCLRTFSYARPCVRCVCLNGNRALVFCACNANFWHHSTVSVSFLQLLASAAYPHSLPSDCVASVIFSFLFILPSIIVCRPSRSSYLKTWPIHRCLHCHIAFNITLLVFINFKPGFHYPSWRPELTGDRFPLPVNTGRVGGRPVSTSRVDGPS